jgi:multidrug efflux system membrane fusion protein
VSVVAAPVTSHDVPIYLRGVGTVIPYNNVIVRSQITGQIIKISFVQGQTVKKGDVLAQIDPSPYQAQLDQAIANRDRDQPHLENARIDLNRYPISPSKNRSRSSLPIRRKRSWPSWWRW